MSLSRSEADLLLRKYTGAEAPIVFVVLLSKSLAGARMHGRLSLNTDDNGVRIKLTSEHDDSGLIFFPPVTVSPSMNRSPMSELHKNFLT